MVTPSRRWSASPRSGSPFRDEHTETWGVLEVEAGPYGPQKPRRVLVATTDPRTLPTLSTWYLITNLPAPSTAQAVQSTLAGADAAEIVRLYGLRQWVEQCYKQTKYALGWSEYQVRSDLAMHRHWALVCCAFAFCRYAESQQYPALAPAPVEDHSRPTAAAASPAPPPAATAEAAEAGRGKSSGTPPLLRPLRSWPVALRAVRAWLEPWIMLWRYWRAWSTVPPPAPLCALLDRLWQGHGIYLYVRLCPPMTSANKVPIVAARYDEGIWGGHNLADHPTCYVLAPASLASCVVPSRIMSRRLLRA